MRFLNFTAIDFETANYSQDSACSLGLVKVQKGKITQKNVYLIRPPSSFFVFTPVHGLTWNDVCRAPAFGVLWPKLIPYFQDVDFIAAHHASFDQRILQGCCKTYQIKHDELPFVCSLKIARQLLGIRPTSLPHVCLKLNIQLQHHEALSDALACAQIILHAAQKYRIALQQMLPQAKKSLLVKKQGNQKVLPMPQSQTLIQSAKLKSLRYRSTPLIRSSS